MIRKMFFLSLFVSLSAFAADAQLKVDRNNNYDLGTKVQGEQVTATIAFENKGQAPLSINNIKTPCGCTKATLSQKVFQPGEKGSFEITINTTRLKDAYDKQLTLFSNDADQPEQKVRVHFKLQAPQLASGS